MKRRRRRDCGYRPRGPAATRRPASGRCRAAGTTIRESRPSYDRNLTIWDRNGVVTPLPRRRDPLKIKARPPHNVGGHRPRGPAATRGRAWDRCRGAGTWKLAPAPSSHPACLPFQFFNFQLSFFTVHFHFIDVTVSLFRVNGSRFQG